MDAMTEGSLIPFAQLGVELMPLLVTEERVAAKLAEYLPRGAQPLPPVADSPVPFEGRYRIEQIRARQTATTADRLLFQVSLLLQVEVNLLLIAFEEQYEITAEPYIDLAVSVHRPFILRFTPGLVSVAHIPFEVQPIGNLFSFAQAHLEEHGPALLAQHMNDLIQPYCKGINFNLLPLLQQADNAPFASCAQTP